ncbi:MAG: hypothetical protein CMJ80_14035 [Planctomycetaceae bacterium]|nr:hypothetical protein [Planctomycetaceae bacterium]MCH2131601.1 hypothetical protein [Pirellulaceae bacterium]
MKNSHLITRFLAFGVIATLTFPAISHGAVISYGENVQGDLSDDPVNPTELPSPLTNLDVGIHTISGKALNDLGSRLDTKDYWVFQIEPNTLISSIKLTQYDTDSYETVGNGGFLGIADSDSITANNGSVGNLIGGALVGINAGTAVNDELVDDLQGGLTFGPFSIPAYPGDFGPGVYSFWFQEGNPTPDTPPQFGGPGLNSEDDFVDYTFEFTVSVVPEPSSFTIASLFSALFMIGARRRIARNN